MMSNSSNRNRSSLLIGLCALAISAALSSARAQDNSETDIIATDATSSAQTTAAAPAREAAPASEAAQAEVTPLKQVEVHPAAKPEGLPGKPYFVEFRARSAYNYGHTFVVHGKVGEPITAKSVVGLHPAGDSGPWTIGHLIPVPSETGWSDGDVGYHDAYIIAKYRVYLSEAEYRVVLAHMRQMQASTPLWHAVIYNCNAFTGDIAAFMGLQHSFHWLMPKDYVNSIRDMNGRRKELPSSWLASQGGSGRVATVQSNGRRHSAVAQSSPAPAVSGPTSPSYAAAH
jgi:hypothetical protein